MQGKNAQAFLDIHLSDQQLYLRQGDAIAFQAAVSTAEKGAGERYGSGCTPRGELQIKLKIGEACAMNTVFVGRRATGEIYTPELGQKYPQRDWVLTRILWLSGLEPGVNRYGEVDTLRRYIYIHGCPDSYPMGVPLSHGCVRMRNSNLVELFDLVEKGLRVRIQD